MHKRAGLVVVAVVAACSGTAVVNNSGGGGAAGSSSTSTNSTSPSSSGGGFAACTGPGQCTLAWPGCCWGCSLPELDDLVPINQAQIDAFREDQCPEPLPCPQCPDCANGNLLAYCDGGTCRGADLRVHELSACASPADCVLRAGTACCESCGAIDPLCGGLTALNQQQLAELAQLVCQDSVQSRFSSIFTQPHPPQALDL